jgi:hypothetical protein
MNFIEVTGGNKFQRDLANKVVHEMVAKLLPRVRTLDITVEIKKLTGDAIGWCMMEDTHKEFTIEISKNLTLKEFITTLCHEMVHVKQYYRKEMDGVTMRWKKGVVKKDTGYYDLPWEKEAYRIQDKLAQEVWDADIL